MENRISLTSLLIIVSIVGLVCSALTAGIVFLGVKYVPGVANIAGNVSVSPTPNSNGGKPKSDIDGDPVSPTGTTPTKGESTTPSDMSKPSVIASAAAPSPSSGSGGAKVQTYTYDYLGIAFDYPAGWSVSIETPQNYMMCDVDDSIYRSDLRNSNVCTNGRVYPQSLIIRGNSGETISLWNGSGLGGCCVDPKDKEIKVRMYGGSHYITLYQKPDGTISTFIAEEIKTGSRSSWKRYLISVNAPAASKDKVIKVLESFRVIN